MNEQWMRWEPIQDLAVNYTLEHVPNGMRGLEIVLADETDVDKQVRVLFPYIMISYTVSATTDTSIDMQGTAKDHTPFCTSWSFFEVANSHYIDRLMEQSATIVATYDPRHFVILTTNARLDVVASYEPEITYVTMDLATKTLFYKELVMPHIISKASTTQVIAYEPALESRFEGQQALYLALDNESLLDTTLVKKIEEDLNNSDIPLRCILTDLHALSEHERDVIAKNGIVWRNKF